MRPYWHRTLDYAQGLQWPQVHVDTSTYREYNTLYMAVTRVEQLDRLKISGKQLSLAELEEKAHVHFKSILFMHEHGGDVPTEALRWARDQKAEHDRQWADHRADPRRH